jgi:hypothetical protein
MDEEFKSFLVTDPDILDEGIDVSGIRQATEQDKLIAGAIAEEPGLAYDPRLTSYLSDLNRYFSGGFPTISTPPTTTPTPPTGGDGGGGGDPGTDGGSGPRGRTESVNPLTQMVTTPTGDTMTVKQAFTDDDAYSLVTPTVQPIDPSGMLPQISTDITGGTTAPQSGFLASGAAGGASLADLDLDNIDLGNPTGDPRVVSEEDGLSGTPTAIDPSSMLPQISTTQPIDPSDMLPQISETQQQNIDGLTTPQSNTLRSIASKVGGDLTQFGKEIASIPGAVFDSLSNTVEVFGEKFNIGKTAAGLVMNKLAGGPISLVFAVGDVLSNILPEPSIQSKTAAIVGIQDPENPGKDIFGKNIDSAFGDYDLMNKQQISNLTDQLTKNATKYGVTVDVNPVTGELEVIGPPTNVSSYNYANAYMLNELDKRTEYDDARSMSDIGQQTITGPNIDEEEGRSDDIGGSAVDFSAPRTAENISNAVETLAEEYDKDVASGEKTADPTVTSAINKAKAQIGMPQMLGDVGGSMDGGSTSSPGFSAPSQQGQQGQSPRGSDSGGDGGRTKIVCTMMNESYGFGSFRNKIWMKFHKDLSPEYQKGYHKLFLPLVKIAKKNKIVKKVLEHIAVHSTIDMRQATRGKTHLLGRVYRKILLPLCYWVGKYVK